MGVLATVEIFLFEEFRLDRQGEGLSRRDERGVFVPSPSGFGLSMFSGCWSSELVSSS